MSFASVQESGFRSYKIGQKYFPKGALLGNIEAGQKTEIAFDLMTGANLMGMTKMLYAFLTGISFAMDPLGGRLGGDLLTTVLAISPITTAFPLINKKIKTKNVTFDSLFCLKSKEIGLEWLLNCTPYI